MAELLTAIATQRDPNLALVAAMATRLYTGLLTRGVNTQFGSNDGGGDSDSDVDGGGQGDTGDGADCPPSKRPPVNLSMAGL